jgi:Holliday junction resolvase
MNSNAKGKQGEREFSKQLIELFGINARRGQQFSGGSDSPDVVTDWDGIHFEVKRTEKLRLWEAIDQAERDANPNQVPIVAHRANGKPWVLILDMLDLKALVVYLKDKIKE